MSHTFEVSNLTMDATFTIFDIWGNEVASQACVAGSDNGHDVRLLHGHYYLKLEKTSPGTTDYRISGKSAIRGTTRDGLTRGDIPKDSDGITYDFITAPNTDYDLFNHGFMIRVRLDFIPRRIMKILMILHREILVMGVTWLPQAVMDIMRLLFLHPMIITEPRLACTMWPRYVS